ncbi:MAG: metal-dependent hydrolase, partial [Candidatus Hodarchaeales archaeon]
MVLFSSHFSIGVVVSLPFVYFDRKSRYRTLIVCGFAATLPDIDFLGVFFNNIEHRGVTHSALTWFIASLLVFLAVIGFIVYDYRKNKEQLKSEVIFDKLIYFVVFTFGWATHVVLDFGFTEYGGRPGSIITIPENYLVIIDQGAAFVVALVLGLIIWYESLDKENKLKVEAKLIISNLIQQLSASKSESERNNIAKRILEQLQFINKFGVSLDELAETFGKDEVETVKEGLKSYEASLKQRNQTPNFIIRGEIVNFRHPPRFI